MGLFDRLGPLPSTKRSPWDLGRVVTDTRSVPLSASNAALTVQTLLYTPGFGSPIATVDVQANSAVVACLRALATAIAEPELVVYTRADGELLAMHDTELGRLLARPNPYFSMDTLLAYATTSLHVDGNAYWRKLRAGDPETGNVVELWPLAPSTVQVRTDQDSTDFITAYRYTYAPGKYLDLPPSSVVHFRYGLEDGDHRLGWSPLKSLIREVSADQMATRYAERLLAKFAVNGLTLSFDKDAPPIDQATADELKARLDAAYGSDNVGASAVLSPGATLTTQGFSPEQMDMKTLHRVPEERIAAVLGVPAIVAGLGAGLDRATYANFKEAREAFTETTLLPLWSALAATITMALVPDFGDPDVLLVDFDTSDVRALADDQNALAERLKILVETGIIDLDEARAELGMEARTPATTSTQPRAAARRVTELRSVGRATKSSDELLRDYQQQRERELPDWERELTSFLDRQLARITRRLRAGADTADDLVPEGEAILLSETLTPLQTRVLNDIAQLVIGELGIAFGLDDPATRQFLRDAGVNIVGITDTTRTAVQDALIEGQMAGEGIEPLARRLRDLPAFGSARARVVARTELGTSQNAAALSSYRSSGVVVGVRVHDGDYDAACQAMNGRTFALDQAPPGLQHPNCVRAFAPITDAAELARSA